MATLAGARYQCGSPGRRQAVLDAGDLNGLDWLEVAPDQLSLTVRCLRPLPGTGSGAVPPAPAPALTPANITVAGGVRRPDIKVTAVAAAGDVLTVTVDRPGDFSTYELRVHAVGDPDTPPDGFDPRLTVLPFSFKTDCANPFDCAPPPAEPPPPLPEPEIDYQAKDYTSFRRLMLDRLAVTLPAWTERNPADQQVMLVELLAFAADRLSYTQDAVATEAYLGTARHRISVRRHARLLDYRIGDGTNARVFVQLTAAQDGPLPPGTAFLAGDPADPDRAIVFEPMHPIVLRAAQNTVQLYTWDDTDCRLPAGATAATLRGDPPLDLAPGDLLLLEEVLDPVTGKATDIDPTHRQVVRLTSVTAGTDPVGGTAVVEVTWADEDALGFDLTVSAVVPGPGGGLVRATTAVAGGNVVLADHGQTVAGEPLDMRGGRRARPRLAAGPVTFTAGYDQAGPASAALGQDPRTALPAMTVAGEGETWRPVYDLLGSSGLATELVVEIDSDGTAWLRFGDDVHGRAPDPGEAFTATYRVGNGPAGNVGAEAVTAVTGAGTLVLTVRNPLPAAGGTGPEPADLVRLLAPQAFRRQERAVTEADWAEVAGRYPGVQKAAARLRWTGSWTTVFVTVDRLGGLEVTPAFEAELRAFLERYRLAGYDLEVDGPVPVPLELVIEVCVRPGFRADQVQRELLQALGSGRLAGGRRGFFHPDNFTFGQPVYLSQIEQVARSVPGVDWLVATTFRRLGHPDNQELEQGLLRPGPLEIAQLANDPNFPEHGWLELIMRGGL